MYNGELGRVCLNWLKYILNGDEGCESNLKIIPIGSKEYEYSKNNNILVKGEYILDNITKGEFKYDSSVKGYIRSWFRSNI